MRPKPRGDMWALVGALLSALVELAKFLAQKNQKPAQKSTVPPVDRAGQELEAARKRAAEKHKLN